MVRHCIAYGCKSRSTKEESKELSWHLLPLSNKELLRTWLIKIKRTNTPVSKNSYLCSKHFEEECFIKPLGGQRIRLKPGSVPSKFVFTVQRKERKRPCCRGEAMDTIKRTASKKINFDVPTDDVAEDDQLEFCQPLDRTQPDEDFSVDHHEPEESREDELEAKISCLHDKISELEKLLQEERSNKKELEILCTRRAFNIDSIKNNNKLMRFYTGFDSYETFSMVLDFLGRDAASQLNYKNNERIVHLHKPKCFAKKYSSTTLIIDATEIYIEQPSNPEAQQLTFSSYKNSNTLKALVGIIPKGSIAFVSTLFGGSISDKEITLRSGLVEKLKYGDCIMADRGFNIQERLASKGVSVNVPPFMNESGQFEERQLLETRRIATLRIHVERAIERIKNYHILDFVPITLCKNGIIDMIFFVCAMLTNFQPPLVEDC
ncbi:uncharacterized protein LOC141894173 [Acropora palmata]|uniref:uncharacterized protein LOC141894173 n=1 Tax=Acropora palmata TaxID=6131 RepID=UPI003DA1AA1C